MFTIIILFDICWFPIKLYQFLIDYDLITFCSEMQFNALIYTYITFHWLAMANSFINPIVYSFYSRSFRVSTLISTILRHLISLVAKVITNGFVFYLKE